MATEAEIGYGATPSYSLDGAAFTELEQSVDITCPELEVPAEQVTNNDSPDACHEYIPRLINPGKVTITHIYKQGVLSQLMGLLRTIVTLKVAGADNSLFVDDAFITSVKKGMPLDAHETLDVVWQLTGLPEFTEGQ